MKKKRVTTINQIKGLLNQYGLSVSSIGLTLKACREIRQMALPEAIRSTIEVHLRIFEMISLEMKVLVRAAEEKALAESQAAEKVEDVSERVQTPVEET